MSDLWTQQQSPYPGQGAHHELNLHFYWLVISPPHTYRVKIINMLVPHNSSLSTIITLCYNQIIWLRACLYTNNLALDKNASSYEDFSLTSANWHRLWLYRVYTCIYAGRNFLGGTCVHHHNQLLSFLWVLQEALDLELHVVYDNGGTCTSTESQKWISFLGRNLILACN